MISKPQSKASCCDAHVILISIPAFASLAFTSLEPVLPRDLLKFGDTGFDVFNVWIILAGPMAALALRSLSKCSFGTVARITLWMINAVGIALSIGLLLAAAGV
jgi:hypothetical protein